MTDDDLLTLDEVARMTDAPGRFVIQTLERDGVKPVPVSGGWIERHKVTNLRWRRADIEAWLDRQGGRPPDS